MENVNSLSICTNALDLYFATVKWCQGYVPSELTVFEILLMESVILEETYCAAHGTKKKISAGKMSLTLVHGTGNGG